MAAYMICLVVQIMLLFLATSWGLPTLHTELQKSLTRNDTYIIGKRSRRAASWTLLLNSVPQSLNEVSSVIHGRDLYVIGGKHDGTFVYNIDNGRWRNVAARDFRGDHSGMHVINNKIYVVGGFQRGQGKVQIYTIASNSWTTNNNAIPSNSQGSMCTAAINGNIYACGGLKASGNTNACYLYNVQQGSWSQKQNMLRGVDHAATGTDGNRMFVFGGRNSGANVPSPGNKKLQIYDPASNSWTWGNDMLVGRGGTGAAAYYQGNFYVMGGETNGAVFDDVIVYNVASQEYSYDTADMAVAVHGHYPVTDIQTGKIFVASGGTRHGNSQSKLLQILDLGSAPTTSTPTKSPLTSIPTQSPIQQPSTSPTRTRSPTNQPTSSTPSTSPSTASPSTSPSRMPTPNFGQLILFAIFDDHSQVEIGPLQSGDVISFGDHATTQFSIFLSLSTEIEALTSSVTFHVDGSKIQTENNAPYTIEGDDGQGVYNPWQPGTGSKTILGTAFDARNGGGSMVGSMSVVVVFQQEPAQTLPPSISTPTETPTQEPTTLPTSSLPTANPTRSPASSSPTLIPTRSPESSSPTSGPTQSPESSSPTPLPTLSPESSNPTSNPTISPESSFPTTIPTTNPTSSPLSPGPTVNPTLSPDSSSPTPSPTARPTSSPESSFPTPNPTANPTSSPSSSSPTKPMSLSPTISPSSSNPSASPTTSPSVFPSLSPISRPTIFPSSTSPTPIPTENPTASPTAEVGYVQLVVASTKTTVGVLSLSNTFSLESIGTNLLTIQLVNRVAVGSVEFMLDGKTQLENVSPYLARGDTKGGSNWRAWTATPGTYTVVVTVYQSSGKQGALLANLVHTFDLFATDEELPTAAPTPQLTAPPVAQTMEPTKVPTIAPAANPTATPTRSPTASPTDFPTTPGPTVYPTEFPTISPLSQSTLSPVSSMPTLSPVSSMPTLSPVSSMPTLSPVSSMPTHAPQTPGPTREPFFSPTSLPSRNPTISPTFAPTTFPTQPPQTSEPTRTPSMVTTSVPSEMPTQQPIFSTVSTPSFGTLHLINAETNTILGIYESGDPISIASLGTHKISFIVIPNPNLTFSSLSFTIPGSIYHVENAAPWCLRGDKRRGTSFRAWRSSPGVYSMTITSHDNADALGAQTGTMTVTVNVVD